MTLAISGAIAGLVVGYVLQRGDLCFHSTFRGLFEHRYELFKAWALAVALGAVGLSIVYAIGPWDGLNRGLAFRPVHNVLGGLGIGVGMVVAASCNSGLFYKLGSGMLGAAVGLVGWAGGEWAAGHLDVPGPTVLGFGDEATVPGQLGVPRLAIAIPLALVVVALLAKAGPRAGPRGAWGWPVAGTALGIAAVGSFVLAGIGGHSFGASTVGAVSGATIGTPPWWLVAFLAAMIVGANVSAATTGGLWVRGERPSRYVGLAVGGFLLGGGAAVAGGCNLGHGLSGAAQLNVSSIVVVGSIVVGIGVARAAQIRLVTARAPEAFHWRPRLGAGR